MNIKEIEAIIDRGEIDLAKSLIKSEEGYTPVDDEEWARLHDCLEKIGMATQDELMTRRYLGQHPEASLPRIRFALRLIVRRIASEAEEQLKIALSRPVHVVKFWKTAAEVYARLNQDDNALNAYSIALNIAPNSFMLRIDNVGILCKSGRTTAARSEFAQILELAGSNITKYLRSAWMFERWNLGDLSGICFERALGVLCDFRSVEAWSETVKWLRATPGQIRKQKMNDIVRFRSKKTLSPAEMAEVRAGEPYEYWSDRFFKIAITHHPEDRNLLSEIFAFAFDKGHSDALISIGNKLLKLDPELTNVKEIVVSLEEMAMKGKLPSLLWWDNLRKLHV